MAAALKASGRAGPVMDELAFTPAPAAGKNLWTLADVSKLVTALGPVFGSSLPLLIDDIEFGSEIPAVELGAYSSPVVGTTGLEEPDQAAAYAAALTAVACKPTVVGLLLGRLVDGAEPGQQSGLYYADGAPKTSLSAFAAAVQTAQTPSRGCTAGARHPGPHAEPHTHSGTGADADSCAGPVRPRRPRRSPTRRSSPSRPASPRHPRRPFGSAAAPPASTSSR